MMRSDLAGSSAFFPLTIALIFSKSGPLGDKQLNDAIVAVTGASVDADETPTLVTRHSLREQRKGATILLVDAHRDSHMLAAHILRKRDSSLVVASDLAETLASLDQESTTSCSWT